MKARTTTIAAIAVAAALCVALAGCGGSSQSSSGSTVSGSSSSASSSAASESAGSASSALPSPSSESSESERSASAASSSASEVSADSAASPTSSSASATVQATAQVADAPSADGEPTLGDFSWYAGAGGIPEGADILTSVYDVEGSWKAYIFGDGMERLCTMRIEAGQADVTATIDWLYVHNSSTDTGSQDDTPDSTFSGDWDGSLGLEALGPGRIALTEFWQQGDRQYATGSFMWPSGETAMVLLVRP